MTLTTSPRPATARPGFSLVELLVAISIIAVLLALTSVAVMKTTESQKNRTSKETVYKLQQTLDAEYQRVTSTTAADRTRIPQAVTDYCEGNPERALSVYTAMQLRRQFPESFAEANSYAFITTDASGNLVFGVSATRPAVPYVLTPLTTFAGVAGVGSAAGGATDPNESAALLYLIIATKSVSGGGAMASSADDLGLQTTVTIGGKQFKAFVDAWGNPIRYWRWDQNPEVQAPPFLDPNNALKDPLDPKNLVAGWTTGGQPNTAKQGQMKTLLGFNGLNRTANVYAIGKDQAYPTGDDILGYRLRRAGK